MDPDRPPTLRRRLHVLERAASTLTTRSAAGSSTADDRSDDTRRPLPSPPTSFEFEHEGEEEDDDGEGAEEREAGSSGAEDGSNSSAHAPAPTAPRLPAERDAHYSPPAPRAWYQPSLPVLAALVAPVGNWLTGGDHVKDALLLILLVLYLHQLIEVPWSLYHAARPRRSAAAGAPTRTAVRAAAELRALELALLALCVLTPLLGAALLRSFVSLTSSPAPHPSSPHPHPAPQPISWFSTTLFALLAALRPLRELSARLSARTAALHAEVHTHTAPSPDAELVQLAERVAQLEKALREAERREGALYAYVDEAVAPLERGVRRVQRRVGRLREKEEARDNAGGADQGKGKGKARKPSTIFVPAPAAPHTPRSASIMAWLAPPLAVIPEEGEASPFASTSTVPPPAHAVPAPPPGPPPPPAPLVFILLGALMRRWVARTAAWAAAAWGWVAWVLLIPLWVPLWVLRRAGVGVGR
ncbi:hypothetical protein B0H10DRAFT_1948566 [Mycena sp. CBHHK59/15]|nr:hypothetical protein B0H10DRAFT_1948566 [Mycena sp. CBHHK59/15]